MAELNTDGNVPNHPGKLKRILEAVLLAAQQPLSLPELRKVFADEIGSDVLRVLLDELRVEWAERPVELLQLASGWRFRTRAEFLPYLARLNPDKPPKYSRAVLETLAIIAYRQPVTREELSVREHMGLILRRLRDTDGFIEFVAMFDPSLGAPVLVVHFLAMLELAREQLLEITQTEAFAQIYVRLANGRVEH